MLPLVVERELMLPCVHPEEVADIIARPRLQVAFGYVEDPVETPWNMESQCIAILDLILCIHLLLSEPSAVAE